LLKGLQDGLADPSHRPAHSRHDEHIDDASSRRALDSKKEEGKTQVIQKPTS